MQSELKQISNLALFAKVVRAGGISKCAGTLGLERTTVSRRLAELEHGLGVKLLSRTPQQLAVTPAGQRCFDQCESILEMAHSAQLAAVAQEHSRPLANILLSAPPEVIEAFLAPVFPGFEQAYPAATIKCLPSFAAESEALVDADISVQWFAPDNDQYLVSNLGPIEYQLCASPEYLVRVGTPQSLLDLSLHSCIDAPCENACGHWTFVADGRKRQVKLEDRLAVSNTAEVMSSTLAGLGLGLMPRFACEPHVNANRLVPVLAEFAATPRNLYMISPQESLDTPFVMSLRLLIEQSVLRAASPDLADDVSGGTEKSASF